MTVRAFGLYVTALALALLLALPAFACMSHNVADLCILPGYALAAGSIGLVFPILSGLLERPFLSLCGIGSRAIWLSIVANYTSMFVVTIPTIIIGEELGNPILGAFVGICMTIVIEWKLLRFASPNSNSEVIGLLIAANIFSAISIILLPVFMHVFGFSHRLYTSYWNQFSSEIQFYTLAACVPVILISIALSLGYWRIQQPFSRQRGFDVIVHTPTPQA